MKTLRIIAVFFLVLGVLYISWFYIINKKSIQDVPEKAKLVVDF